MIKNAGMVAKSIAGAIALAFLAGPVAAGGLKDDPAPTDRMLQWSANFAVTSDYIFRGFSQSRERPAVQGGVDLTYGILYAGFWSSGIDFGENGNRTVATAEVDFVAGIKPKLGAVSFDFGVIYYTYPGAFDPGAELNYVELKAGASVEPWKGATVGVTYFYSPEYTGKTGAVHTIEGSFAQELPKVHMITPTFSGVLGFQTGNSAAYSAAFADGDDHYFYWNAGVSLGFHERFSLDLRYWGTSNSDGFCNALGKLFNCDDRFVATAKMTF